MNQTLKLVNGISINVIEAGPSDGPLILFLHGFPEFSYGWRRQIDFFAAHGYHVLAPDQRGYNLSTKPKSLRAYAMNKLMEDMVGLIEPILKQSGQTQAFLVGHDWGGAVSWNLVTHYPQFFKKLIAINMPHPVAMMQAMNFRQMCRSWYMGMFQIPFLPEAYLRMKNFAALAVTLKKTSIRGTFTDAEIKEYKKAWAMPGALSGMVNWYRAIRFARELPHVSGKIKLPVLILWGKKDRFLGHNLAEASLQKCENAELVFFEDATHWLHLEKAKEVNDAIFEFIRR